MNTEEPAQRTVCQAMERELLELVSRGLANKEIAHDLGISAATVNKRLARLMRRFAVHSRTALVRSALAAGVIAFADGAEDVSTDKAFEETGLPTQPVPPTHTLDLNAKHLRGPARQGVARMR